MPAQTPPDRILVFQVRKETACTDCGEELRKGRLLRLEGEGPLCLSCADLDHLVFLPRGDTALTRRATRHSGLSAVVLRWSTARKHYERQGTLVESEALDRAEQECVGDEELRERRRERAAERREELDAAYVAEFARRLRERYPSSPSDTETRVAEHACRKFSGRVGRTASAKEFAPEALDFAIRAHVRHVHSGYDAFLQKGIDRADARAAVREQVEGVLASWRCPRRD